MISSLPAGLENIKIDGDGLLVRLAKLGAGVVSPVGVGGGGIQLGYEAMLPFDGKTYPSNPTVPPARHLSEKVPGEIVIAPNAGDRPLFP